MDKHGFFEKQLYNHEPEKGVYGDCSRTLIANMLGIPRDDVPHFLHDDCDNKEYRKRLDEYLAKQDLYTYTIAYPGELSKEEVMNTQMHLNPGAVYILIGTSATGCNHNVMCKDNFILHDPSQTNSGIVGPCEDGYFYVELLVRIIPFDVHNIDPKENPQ